ncbi:hypothetical protein POM88_040474 [Heracleum sosnowskyi]|uniref:Response regulatory domain-containing protein n=1 Tax=Heracleum sosnowskyi TaxID=360622 RepID=A0AAD8HE60_9APIA|nr:hypothetical protein POM88_040474 [Heracleum sosnowskyi]
MDSILIVDQDRTCLLILEACLKKWNYQVTPANNVPEALGMLRSNSFDMVMAEVHMPDTNGFQLVKQIDEEFNLPVILMSADITEADTALENGAQRFFVKPIKADDVKEIWQYSLWWKTIKSNSTARVTNHPNAGDGVSSATTNTAGAEISVRRKQNFTWTPDMHFCFGEALLFIGYKDATPSNIVEKMKVPGLTRMQVGSHLQKYQEFLQGVLDGTTKIQSKKWIDLDYHSSYFSGNPDLLLINQLREEQRNGRLSAHNPLRPTNTVRAPNGSSSSGQYRPLPPSTIAEGSSIISATLLSAHIESMRNMAGRSTSNAIHDLTYEHRPLTQQQNYLVAEGLVGGAINHMIPSTNNVVPSSTAPLGNKGYSQQSTNVGGRGSGDSYYGNNFTDLATHQLGNNCGDLSIGCSLNASQFGNTSAMNAHVQNSYGIHVSPQLLPAYPQGTPGYGQQEKYGRLPPYGSSSSGQYRPLPSSTIAKASSTMSATLPNTHIESMGNIAGYSTSNTIHDLTYVHTLPQEQNNYPVDGGLVGGAINDMIPPRNNVVTSGTAPLANKGYSQQSMNVGGRGSCDSYYGNNFTDQASHQLGNNCGDSSIGRLLNASQFENTSAMNAHVQNPYRAHVAPQRLSAYPQVSTPGSGQQEQYGRPPSYGMPPQGPQVQYHGQPKATQPAGYMPYQGAVSSTVSYGHLTLTQQPYPYASGGQMQPTYPPYISAPSVDGYNQPLRTAATPGYPQQGVHPASGYGQPGIQQSSGYSQPGVQQASGHAQAGQTGVNIQYPSAQQGPTVQAIISAATQTVQAVTAAATAGAYHGAGDPAYSSAPAVSYGAQPTYTTQPAPNQTV